MGEEIKDVNKAIDDLEAAKKELDERRKACQNR